MHGNLSSRSWVDEADPLGGRDPDSHHPICSRHRLHSERRELLGTENDRWEDPRECCERAYQEDDPCGKERHEEGTARAQSCIPVRRAPLVHAEGISSHATIIRCCGPNRKELKTGTGNDSTRVDLI